MPEFSIRDDTLEWLLEPSDPGARYLAMRKLLDAPEDDPELATARQAAYDDGPIAGILAEMHPSGYWAEPGPGYSPKYRSTVWTIILLAQLGAEACCDGRIRAACEYLIEQSLTRYGQFSSNGAPGGTVDCLQGNLCASLLDLGIPAERLDPAFEWMARTVTGEGLAPFSDKHAPLRYYAGKRGPNFECGANNNLPCAWGGVKVLLALGKLPASRRTPLIERAIQQGLDFFFSVDPATAAYPNGWAEKPSGNWWKFGFPVFYVTDLLQLVEALVSLGCQDDPRLQNALALVRSRQDASGRWALEYDYAGKTWVDFGPKKQPNKWVTIRALAALQNAALQNAAIRN